MKDVIKVTLTLKNEQRISDNIWKVTLDGKPKKVRERVVIFYCWNMSETSRFIESELSSWVISKEISSDKHQW